MARRNRSAAELRKIADRRTSDRQAARPVGRADVKRAAAQKASARRPRRWAGFGIVVAVAGLLALLWPQVSVLFSPARTAIDQLRGDSVYVEPGVTGVDADQIRGVIGTRPIIALVVDEDGDLDENRREVCSDVANYFDDVIVVVIAGGEWQRGCEGGDVDLNEIKDIDSLDITLWAVAYPRLTQFLDGDPTAQVEQLALLYDKLVRDNDLFGQVRTFEAGPTRYLLASVEAAIVIAAGVTGFILLRRVVGVQVRRADRRSGWVAKHDDLDLKLSEIGLLMVQESPADPTMKTAGMKSRRLGDLAPEYLAVLSDLESAEPGSDLSALADRITALEELSRPLATGQR